MCLYIYLSTYLSIYLCIYLPFPNSFSKWPPWLKLDLSEVRNIFVDLKYVWEETQTIVPSYTAFLGHYQETALEVEQLGLALTSLWDTSTPGNSFTHYTTELGSFTIFLKSKT